jgi:hypothetical protein
VESILARRVTGISQNLHKALITHSRHAHDDVTASLIEHARTSLIYERAKKKELEALRGDFRAINQPPQPRIAIPSASTAVLPTGQSPSQSVLASQQHSPSSSVHTIPHTKEQPPPMVGAQKPDDVGPLANVTFAQGNRPQSPLRNTANGGRPFDGSQSMFVSPSRPAATNGPRSGVVDPLSASVQATRPNIGPNGSVRDAQKGRSVFIEPARGKIDQREAARKLANFL